jgi:hypothetical protein
MKQIWILSALVLLLIALTGPTVGAAPVCAPEAPLAAISLAGGVPYTQNFDTLANSGTNSTVPDGWALYETGSSANATYAAGTGSSTTGDTYSFGAGGSTERSFGGLQSNSLIPIIGAEFMNGTGATISSLAVSYNCEQWRLGTIDRTDRMDFQYSLDATSLSTGNWTDVDTLDCSGVLSTGTTGVKDGNTNRITVSGSVTSLSIASGATFWLRWTAFDASGSDDGLAVDDLQVTAQNTTAVTLRTLSAAPQGVAAARPLAGLALLGGRACLHRRHPSTGSG